MKKWLFAVIALMGMSLWAVPESDFYAVTTQYRGHNILTTADTNLSVRQVSSSGYDAFGYFVFDSSALPTSASSLDLKQLTFDSAGLANIGNVNANTDIGFWMTTSEGTVYSIQTLNEQNFNAIKRQGFYDGEPLLRMGTYDNHPMDNIKFIIDAGPAKPTGQPLPGVLISAFLGLASLAGWKFGRKKS